MQAVFNELSTPHCENKELANIAVLTFIRSYISLQKKGFKGIRFYPYLYQIPLAPDFNMQQWVEESTSHTLKNIFLSQIRHPFIDPNDTTEEEEFVLNRYYFEDVNIGRLESIGLGTADIYKTLTLSFSTDPKWCKSYIEVIKIGTDGEEQHINVPNVYSDNCPNTNHIKLAIEEMEGLTLVETPINPSEKSINLRDDHGSDILEAFATKIRTSPFVISIVNSLPFNPKFSKFIKRIKPGGLIEIVLHWDDRGIGMVIQTTGRNMKETTEIANRLESNFT